MIYLNKPYKCQDCGTEFVVLNGNGKFKSYLPVEIINGTELYDQNFDKDKHVSHLLNCPALQAKWQDAKEIIDKTEYNKSKLSIK